MDLEDRVTIATPEGVEIELVVAGLGSRFAAALVDGVIQGVLVGAMAIAMAGIEQAGGQGFALAAFAVGYFLVIFGYHALFEALLSGRTPGKRTAGIRVVRARGEPPGFSAVAVRNLLRVVDFLPMFYVVGAAFVLVTSRHQRLGDIAAGTLVVRERRPSPFRATVAAPPGDLGPLAAWDVSGVTADEAATVRRFLERRVGLDRAARDHLAAELTARLRPRVPGAPANWPPEAFLEALAAVKAARS